MALKKLNWAPAKAEIVHPEKHYAALTNIEHFSIVSAVCPAVEAGKPQPTFLHS